MMSALLPRREFAKNSEAFHDFAKESSDSNRSNSIGLVVLEQVQKNSAGSKKGLS